MTTTNETTLIAKRTFNATQAATALANITTPAALRASAAHRGITIPETATNAEIAMLILKHEQVAIQGHYAGVCIDVTHGEGLPISPSALTAAVAAAFPGAGVGPRHGPHYLCHARKGRLKGLRAGLPAIPFSRNNTITNSATANSDSVIIQDIPEATDETPVTVATLMAENDRKTLQDMAKGMGLKAGGTTEDIATRIVANLVNPTNPLDSKNSPNQQASV